MAQAAAGIHGDVTYRGDNQGAVLIHPGGRLVITGTHAGAVIVYGGGHLVIRGHLQGGLQIFPSGHCLIDVGGTHDGELNNEGEVSQG